jgi:hypothetical protein
VLEEVILLETGWYLPRQGSGDRKIFVILGVVMDEKFYQMFYSKAVLPQFGIKTLDVVWGERRVLGPDESAWPFRIWDTQYILIYEDYQGLGNKRDYVKEKVVGSDKFEYVEPTSKTSAPPSYNFFHLPAPYKYVRDITGTFTLVKLLNDKDS